MTEVLIDYTQRAANVALPTDWQPPFEDVSSIARLFTRVRTAGFQRNTFFNDISEYQAYLDQRYPYPMVATRIDNGWSTDNHWHGNRDAALRMNSIKLWQNYLVYIPNEERAVLSRVKNNLGANPPAKATIMIDMESGQGFAGPGNHSSGANWLADELADYLGTRKRVSPYANTGDYANCWPQLAGWLVPRKNVASYGSFDPGSYAWQYYGALPYPVPGGYPTRVDPFGSYVDFNVIHKSINQILVDFGIKKKEWSDMATEKAIEALIDKKIAAFTADDTNAAVLTFARGGGTGRWNWRKHPKWAHKEGEGALDRILLLEQEVARLQKQLNKPV